MQELAAALSDADFVEAWRDIEDAARTILLTGGSTQADPGMRSFALFRKSVADSIVTALSPHDASRLEEDRAARS